MNIPKSKFFNIALEAITKNAIPLNMGDYYFSYHPVSLGEYEQYSDYEKLDLNNTSAEEISADVFEDGVIIIEDDFEYYYRAKPATAKIAIKNGIVISTEAVTCSGHSIKFELINGTPKCVGADDMLSFFLWGDVSVHPFNREKSRITAVNSGKTFKWAIPAHEYTVDDEVKAIGIRNLLSWPLEDQEEFLNSDIFLKAFLKSDNAKVVLNDTIETYKGYRSSGSYPISRFNCFELFKTIKDEKSSGINKVIDSPEIWDILITEVSKIDKKYTSLAVQNRKDVTARCLRRRARKASAQA